MKKWLGIVAIGAMATVAGCQKSTPETDEKAPTAQAIDQKAEAKAPVVMNEQEKVGYAVGVMMAEQLKHNMSDVSVESLINGLRDGQTDHPVLSLDESQKVILAYQQQQVEKVQKQREVQGVENLKAGEAFQQSYAKKEGVKKTASGLLYHAENSGNTEGVPPTDEDTVQVAYEGRHLNGEVFDTTKDQGGSVSFPVNAVIPGWQEALKLMRAGDEWEVIVPASLAYGTGGVGSIGPNETLIFKINLLKVTPAKAH